MSAPRSSRTRSRFQRRESAEARSPICGAASPTPADYAIQPRSPVGGCGIGREYLVGLNMARSRLRAWDTPAARHWRLADPCANHSISQHPGGGALAPLAGELAGKYDLVALSPLAMSCVKCSFLLLARTGAGGKSGSAEAENNGKTRAKSRCHRITIL